jgi:riboflavin kinase
MPDNKVNQFIHLPDLQFVQLCEEHFHVNRGVYNIIDAWFYEKGIKNISTRRRIILAFFKYIHRQNHGKIKFGPGGVKNRLEEYWEENIHLIHSIKDSKVDSA